MDSFDELLRVYKQNRLCLFVGAGVSMSCGLADWQGLAREVTRSIWSHDAGDLTDARHVAPILREKALDQMSPLESMRYVRQILGKGFKAKVTESLYPSHLTTSDTVHAIVSMRKVRRICCYNYDDLLETAFEAAGREFACIVEADEVPFLSDTTLIFHPHGYLPRRRRQRHAASSDVVLSEDDYYRFYSTPYSWSNIIQLSLLLNYSAVFVGCSLTDPNVRRILDLVAKVRPAQKHYALLRDPVPVRPAESNEKSLKNWFWIARFREAEKKVKTRDWESRGVLPIWFGKYSDIPSVLMGISRDDPVTS